MLIKIKRINNWIKDGFSKWVDWLYIPDGWEPPAEGPLDGEGPDNEPLDVDGSLGPVN